MKWPALSLAGVQIQVRSICYKIRTLLHQPKALYGLRLFLLVCVKHFAVIWLLLLSYS